MPFQGMPTADDFRNNRVINGQQSEVIRKRYYDYMLYPAAGSLSINFFSQAIGQGQATAPVSAAGALKTIADTNLEMPNTLPSGREFLVESIEVEFFPGSVSTANTYTAQAVAQFNAANSLALSGGVNDTNIFLQSGTLTLSILSKPYMQDGPMKSFPSKTQMEISGFTNSTSATASALVVGSAKACGRPYYLEPPITLQPAVNFSFVYTVPALVPMPSTFNARMGVVLDGYEMRSSQ